MTESRNALKDLTPKAKTVKIEVRNKQEQPMKILFYRYGNICEPDIIEAFQRLNIEVIEECSEMTNKKLTGAQQVDLLQKQYQSCVASEPFLFIFSVNYFPSIAEFCHIIQIPYVCWTVDCPVLELFSNSIKYNTNFIFLFDYAQYEYFQPQNPDHIFYLPLATNVRRWDQILHSDRNTISYQNDAACRDNISFVGSLYTEKCKYNDLKLSPYADGFLTGLMEAQLRLYGCNFIEDALTPQIIAEVKAAANHFYSPEQTFTNTDAYVVANDYIGFKLAEQERIRTLNLLANYFDVNLYTRSDTRPLKNVHVKGGVQTLTEMPLVFANSRINLNITMRPIQTGLSLRVYDIMGCGGFLMTNFQSELTEYFTIGQDLESYGSPEELVDKCAYYLEHEEERLSIARNGYEKVKGFHTYDHRIKAMICEIGKRL